MIQEDTLRQLVSEGKTVFEIMEILACSRNTVRSYITKYGLSYGPGFFRRPWLKIGTPKGTPKSEKWYEVMRARMAGEGNAFYGKKHTKRTRKKMSKNHADFTGYKNPFKNSLTTPGKREEHSSRCKALWDKRDATWRSTFGDKLSKSMALRTAGQKVKSSHFDYGWFTTRKGGRCFCRSSWEKFVCKRLESSASVVSFSLEGLTIPYAVESGTRHCVVDFIVKTAEDSTVLMEVKPLPFVRRFNNPIRLRTMKNYCKEHGWMFAILTRKDEGLLNRILEVSKAYGNRESAK